MVSPSNHDTMRPRYIAIDLLRTAAILGMVLYHAAYDLETFRGWDLDVNAGGWKVFQVCVASLFLLLVGVSAVFSQAHPWKRFARIGGAALLVSAGTYLFDPNTFVYFGILHLIALSALLLPLLRPLREGTILIGLVIVALGIAFPLAAPFPALDYFPPFPWLGIPFVGFGIGQWYYVRHDRIPHPAPVWLQWLTWPGRHSLIVYLIHQPILLMILG